MYALMNAWVADPSAFGLTNVTDTFLVFDSNGNPIGPAATDTYLFWDYIHPTTYAHGLIADVVMNSVAPVPEPTTMVLF